MSINTLTRNISPHKNNTMMAQVGTAPRRAMTRCARRNRRRRMLNSKKIKKVVVLEIEPEDKDSPHLVWIKWHETLHTAFKKAFPTTEWNDTPAMLRYAMCTL